MRTLDLVDQAEATGKSLRTISLELGLPATQLAKSRHDGKLSPALAAALAQFLGQDPARWALIAATESSKNPPGVQRRLLAAVRNL